MSKKIADGRKDKFVIIIAYTDFKNIKNEKILKKKAVLMAVLHKKTLDFLFKVWYTKYQLLKFQQLALNIL